MTATIRGRERVGRIALSQLTDPLYLNSYYLMAGTAVAAGSGFVFWIVAARLTDPAAVGRASALLSAVTLLTYLTSLGLPYGLLRFGHVTRGFASMFNVAIALSAASSAAAAAIFILGVEVWAPELHSLVDSPTDIALFLAATVFIGMGVMLDNVFSARRIAKYALLRNVIASVLKLGAVVPLAAFGAIGLYAANVVPALVVALGMVATLPLMVRGYRVRSLRDEGATREMLTFSLSSFPSSLLAGAPPFFLPLIVLGVGGAREAAFFYVSWSLIAVLLLLPNMVSNMSMAEGVREGAWATARKARAFALAIVVPATLVVAVFASQILTIFGPEYAENAVAPLRIFCLSLLPWTFKSVTISALRAESRYGLLTTTTAVFAVCSVAGPLVLGIEFGLMGVAIGWTGGLVLAAVIIEILARGPRRAEAAAA